MGIPQFIVKAGERVSHFAYHGLRALHYRYGHSTLIDSSRQSLQFERDPAFERETIAYWKERTGIKIDPIWADVYSDRNGIRDVRYVPASIYNAYIEPHFNRLELAKAWQDKSDYLSIFPQETLPEGGRRPPVLLRCVGGIFTDGSFHQLSLDAAAEYLSSWTGGSVVKDSIGSSGGAHITYTPKGERKSPAQWRAVIADHGGDFVVEGLIAQCAEMAALNPTSINTLRLMTYLNRDGARVLSAVCRIGRRGANVDNFSSGGIACGITEDGYLKDTAYDHHFNTYKHHPDGGEFAGAMIPGYDRVKRFVTALAPRFGHFRLISWDIAVDEEHRPVLVEYNLSPQGIDIHMFSNGPLFGESTDEILSEVFQKR